MQALNEWEELMGSTKEDRAHEMLFRHWERELHRWALHGNFGDRHESPRAVEREPK